MAGHMSGILPTTLSKAVSKSKVLVVGAGGIGCELIKNLVLSGFCDLEVIDLDTIDVSNLNRQFLFRKEHVGKSKSQVARESALKFNPKANIIAYHDSVMSPEYGVEFFQKFSIVLNALDNRGARSHVNRMCLAANVPLVESGTAGYLGQVSVIKKGLTECYDCQPKPAQKTFPGCTIRNTPSEPIHCIVWAKHLFNQLFGEDDPDQDVSPDTEDPEAAGDAGTNALTAEAKVTAVGGIARKSTKVWAQETEYDPDKLFNKFFRDDIKYLLSMENLWKKRKPPTPLDLTHLSNDAPSHSEAGIADQRVWSPAECAVVFKTSIVALQQQLARDEHGILAWDKDDISAMNFVTATSNLRSFVYGIPLKSRFDIKSMAGNIIPAIATTNAIIAGLIVMEAFKLLEGRISDCRDVFLNRQPTARKRLLNPCTLNRPNPKCYVCSEKPELTVLLNMHHISVKVLEDKILKAALGMVAPDVEIDNGRGTILISSEEGETEENAPKSLATFCQDSHLRLKCDDFVQVYSLTLTLVHVDKLPDDKEYDIVGNLRDLQAKVQQETEKQQQQQNVTSNGAATAGGDADDDLFVLDDKPPSPVSHKRKAGNEPTLVAPNKRQRSKLLEITGETSIEVDNTQPADGDSRQMSGGGDYANGSSTSRAGVDVVEIADDDVICL